MAGENEENRSNGGDTSMQRVQSSFGTSSSSINQQKHQQQQQNFLMNQLEIPQLSMPQFRGQIRQFSPNLGVENGSKRVGIPPSHPQIPPVSPYSQIPVSRNGSQQIGVQNFSTSPGASHHSRSLSQPAFFAHDLLPPLSPSPYRESGVTEQVSADVSMEEREGCSSSLLPPSPFTRGRVGGESLPPRRGHKRSNSDIPFGFSTMMQPSPSSMPLRSPGAQPVQLVKRESSWDKGGESNGEGTGERKGDVDIVDDLFTAYMNLDNIDAFNSSETDEKLGYENREDIDSRASGSRTNGGESSDNEATSSVNESGSSMSKPGVSSLPEHREVSKRNAVGDIAPTSRHYRSVSMDSFMGSMNFADESPRMPPSPGSRPGQLSPTNSIDSNGNAFSLEFGNGEFSGAELKKIMANEKLAEIASSDPKRAKR